LEALTFTIYKDLTMTKHFKEIKRHYKKHYQSHPFHRMHQLITTQILKFFLIFFQKLYPEAEFIIDTLSRFDYAQGNIGMSEYPQYCCFIHLKCGQFWRR